MAQIFAKGKPKKTNAEKAADKVAKQRAKRIAKAQKVLEGKGGK